MKTNLRFIVASAVILFAFLAQIPPADGATISWIGQNGDWNTPTNWSTGALPGPDDDVVIDVPGNVTVTHSTGTHSVRGILSQEVFVLSGGSIAVSNIFQVSANLSINDGATLRGGTVVTTNGARLYAYGGNQDSKLDGVTINGDLDLTGYGGGVKILNGLTLNGTVYVGTQSNTDYSAHLKFIGSQSLLGNGTVLFGLRDCNGLWPTEPGTTLTIGPGITVRGRGGYNFIGSGVCIGVVANTTVINQGIIRAEGGTIVIASQNVTNLGTLHASGGALDVRGLRGNVGNAAVTNRGTLILDGAYVNDQDRTVIGSTFTLRGNWTNAASITLSNATLNLAGTWANHGSFAGINTTNNLGGNSPQLGAISFPGPGSVVNVTGSFTSTQLQSIGSGPGAMLLRDGASIDNRNQVIALDETTGNWSLTGGTIRGGTVTTTNGARLYAYQTGAQRGVLDGVTINGELDLTGYGAQVTVLNGLTLNGTMYVGSVVPPHYWQGFVFFSGSQTLTGTGTVLFGTDGRNELVLIAGTTLTLGPGITVRGGGGNVWREGHSLQNVFLINEGNISSDTGTIRVLVQGMTNHGTVRATGGTLSATVQDLDNQGLFLVTAGALDITRQRGELGRLQSSGGTIRINGVSTNIANVQAASGGAIQVSGSYQLDDVHLLDIQSGAAIQLTGDLFGETRTPALNSLLGIILLNGGGDALTPRFLEVMAQDIGPNIAGFSGGFAFGTLVLSNNTYLRLVDAWDNSPGAQPEAVYVNSLVVPPGSTLDLAGRNLYARSIQASGSVVGGNPVLIPDGGPISLGQSTAGNLAQPGEADEWTFFGRAGQSMAVLVDTGSGSVLPPCLNFAEARVLDPLDRVIAVGTNSAAGQMLALTDLPLSLDGTYRVQVRAPVSQPSSAGNYLITVLEITPDETPLVLNQTSHGRIETLYSIDRWTFSAVAGQQVRFDFINASASGVAFTLRGPNGWIGFSNLVADSDLVSLPASGAYTLTVFSLSGAYDIDYAFRLTETVQTELALNGTFTGQFVGNGQAMLFRINLPGNQPFQISLQNAGTNNRVELYAGFGLPPTRGSFAFADNQGAGSSRSILADNNYPGIYYVLVYGDSIPTPGAFTLSVQSADFFVTKLNPDRGADISGTSIVEIQGVALPSGAQVRLEGNGTSIAANSVTWVSSTRIIAEFNLLGVPHNTYQCVVTQGGTSASLPFVVAGGFGAKFVSNLITPTGIGFNTVETLYVEFANVGDLPMVAPLLAVRGSSRCFVTPQFTLNPAEVGLDFWAASQPSVSESVVSFFATGRVPGILLPGESGRVPIHFVGMNRTFGGAVASNRRIVGWRVVDDGGGFVGCGFTFSLLQYLPPSVTGLGDGRTQPDKPLDWSSLRTNVPPHVEPAAWDAIWMNYTNAVGGSVYSFFGMLEQNVKHLGTLGFLGNSLSKVNDLLSFEVAQADGLHMLRTLATATDAYAPTPGLRLSLDRSFPNTISSRYRLGPLGRGWSHNWEDHLVKDSFGDVTILGQHGSQRLFKPDLRGGYLPGLGDYGRLVSLPGNAFRLQEKGGLVKQFRSDGRLDFASDPNGNRITCSYTVELLTSLKHSSGQELRFAYNAQSRIQSITDLVGRTTRFTYDASGEHLETAEYYDGRGLRYQYSTAQGAQREHALTEVQFPDQSHQYFTYNSQGRLESMSRDGGSDRVTYAYDNAGTVFATDPFNNTSRFLFDNRGLLAQMQNPKGEVVKLGHDERFNLTSVIDPAGRSFKYTHDRQGDLTQITDPLGHRTQFAYEPQFHRLRQLIDANGNPTRYHHDTRGNLTGITDAAGKTENWGYDASGTPTTWTNRRRNDIHYRFNPTNGLLLAKLYPDGSRADYEYDARGNLTAASNYTGRITLGYFPTNDRLQRITYPGNLWLEYTYDAAGRRQTMIDQLGYQLHYDYDTLGRLRSITNSENIRIVHYQYDAAGRIVLKTLGNSVSTSYTYDVAGRLEKLTNSLPNGSAISFFNYTYDQRGRRTAIETHFGTWTYRYDDLGQLTNAVLASTEAQIPNQDLNYLYDAMGNRVQTIENGLVAEYTPNILNQYTDAGPATYLFDSDGNLAVKATAQGTNAFLFDFENRLINVVMEAQLLEHAYDALGNRLRRTENSVTELFVIDPIGFGNIVGEYNSVGGLNARYSHGSGLILSHTEETDSAYYTFDGLGNVQQLTANDGTMANSYAYKPFGETLIEIASIPNPFRFVGDHGVSFELNGLSLMRTRYYSHGLGRFISEDPISPFFMDANLYRYALGNPVSFIDSTGLSVAWDIVTDVGTLVGAIGGVSAAAGLPGAAYAPASWLINPFSPVVGGVTFAALAGVGSAAILGVAAGELLLYFDPKLGTFYGDLAFDWWNKFDWDNAGSTTLVPIFASDPNQKLVLTGLGEGSYVQSGALLPYRIDFENDTNATAPAQSVFVTDRLANTLDWPTFELTEIGFGDERLMLPPQTQHYETNLPVTINGASYVVQIQAGIRLDTGEAFCTFRSLDLTTDLPPPANSGFLPPENGTGRGQGHFTFFVRPRPGLPTGTEIRNVALVDFDGRETIATDQVDPHNPGLGIDTNKQARVTIDAGAPTSSVTALPAESGHAFVVQWSGQDDVSGSGIASYDVLVSTNGGPFSHWFSETNGTSAAFIGELGKSYAFYSIARDRVGNVEAATMTADAHTMVVTNAPLLALVPDQVASVGAGLVISNMFQGLPAGSFLSLGPRAPSGASINPSNGVLRWTPACSQGSTTNTITVWATDRVRTNISDAISISVAVKECVAPQLGRLVLRAGDTGLLPIDLISSVPLTNLITFVSFPTNRFIHLGVEALSTQICLVTIAPASTPHPGPLLERGGEGGVGGGSPLPQGGEGEFHVVTLGACTNQSLIGTQQVAWLVLTAVSNQPSAFVPIEIGPSIGIQPDGTPTTNYITQTGTVVVVGEEPLLEALRSTNGLVQTILYAPVGSTNAVQTSHDLSPQEPWLLWQQVTPTNLFQPLSALPATNRTLFIRAIRQ